MTKVSTWSKALIASLAILPMTANAARPADSYPLPASSKDGVRGATVPYTRYDCNYAGDAQLSGGASMERDKTWNRFIITSQASDQTYVKLPVGESVTWNMRTYGNGVTVRYTIKDSNEGSTGKEGGYALNEGELEFYVNDTYAGKVVLSSYYMYQHFTEGSGDPSQTPSSVSSPAFAFDERHTLLNTMMKPGDRLTVKCKSGQEVGVDFVETEVVEDPFDESSDEVRDGGRQIFNVKNYGAVPNDPKVDNRSAFNKAIAEANRVKGIVFIPEGTWYIGLSDRGNMANQQGIWGFSANDVKIVGAGMWHTNIQFTGWGMFGGGVSAGNPTIGGTQDGDRLEFCHMYLNSNLAWRNEPQAVYKALMDLWADGTLIHDIWEEHFEAGIWLGDYNNSPRRWADGTKIVNSRIRNNLADGVNLCQGSSNCAVINCSVRNNGDDGLACWCAIDGGAPNESGNTFCYNTVEHTWRAGAIAIYGGLDQKVYNNWMGESFISSGFHSNDTFPGHGWTATADKPVIVENNYFVSAGSYWDIYRRPYGAIDLQQSLSNIHFRNNHFWECPGEALSIHNSQTNVTFDGVYVNGAGLSGQSNSFDASEHTVGAGGFQQGLGGMTFNNFQIVEGSVPDPTVGTSLSQLQWPFWNATPDFSWVSEDAIDWADTPPYPDSGGIIPAPNPLDDLTGYDIVLTGLDWITNQDKHSMYEGDNVAFQVRIDNKGTTAIPSGAKFNVTVTVDGKAAFSYTVQDGIEANAYKILQFEGSWAATRGQHTFLATVDPNGKLKLEENKANNTRTKDVNVNAIPEGEEPEIEVPTHSGYDMGVVKVYFENTSRTDGEFQVGDILVPHAIVANYGSNTINLGSGQGFLWGFDGMAEYNSGMLWDDTSHTIQPGEWIDITPNGGGSASGSLTSAGWNTDYTYTVKEGTVSLFGRMDNPSKYNDDTASNNSAFADYEFPITKPVYNENPDKADNLLTGGYYDYEDGEQGGEDPEVTGYDLEPTLIFWTPGTSEIEAGKEMKDFKVRITNQTNIDLPADKAVRVTLRVSGQTVGTATWNDGILGEQYVDLDIPGIYVPAAGAHTVEATIARIAGEGSAYTNTRTRTFNAKGESAFEEPARFYETGYSTAQVQGRSLVLTRIDWFKVGAPNDPIRPGDQVRFKVTLYNNGTETTPFTKHGFLFETMPGFDPKFWSDDFTEVHPNGGIAPGETVELTTNGSYPSQTNGIWTALEGTTTFNARIDNCSDLGIPENNVGVNPLSVEIANGPTAIEYHENPTGDDSENVETGIGSVEAAENQPVIWYTLQGIRVAEPTTPGIYIRNGKKVMVK